MVLARTAPWNIASIHSEHGSFGPAGERSGLRVHR